MILQRRKTFDMAVKDAYWSSVGQTLTDLFGVAAADADHLCFDRRAAVDLAPRPVRSDIFYHQEPFEVARSIAEARTSGGSVMPTLADPQTNLAYEAILKKHGLA